MRLSAAGESEPVGVLLQTSVEGKFPMRSGTVENPTEYIDTWKTLETGVDRKAPLSEFYSEEIIDQIAAGADSFARWGFPQGQGELVTAVYTSLPVPAAVGEVLDGAMSAEEAVAEAAAVIEEELELIGG